MHQGFEAVALRPTLAAPPLRRLRTLESALAACLRRCGGAAATVVGHSAALPSRRPRPLARLETLVAWAPGDARCAPFTPPQARELAAACSELPAFRSARVLIYSVDASEPGHSARDALEATAALPPASRVALHLRGVDDGAARDVAAALDADASAASRGSACRPAASRGAWCARRRAGVKRRGDQLG